MEAERAKRFVVLDFYRFVAALGVFIFHLKFIDKGISPAWNGSFGLFVDMFFILSGFVISYSYPSGPIGARGYARFMTRRVARIYPLHLLTLLIFVFIGWLGLAGSSFKSGVPDFFYNLFLVQGWGVTDHLSFNTPSWSISAELFCYIFFPVLMLVATKVSPVWLAAIVAAGYGILAHGHLPIWHDRSQMYGANFDYSMLRALPSFMNGILLVVLFRLAAAKKPPRIVLAAGIAVFAVAVLILNIFAKPDLAIILFSLAILFTAVGENAFAGIPGARWLEFFGNTSYAIYMLHELMIILIFKPLWTYLGLTPGMFGPFALGCCITLTAVAHFTYVYIENPARIFINRLAPSGSRSGRKDGVILAKTEQAAS